MLTKMVIVIRKDLHMRRGKECAQSAHSVMKVFLDRARHISAMDGSDPGRLEIPLTRAMEEWTCGIFTKVTCSVNSEQELVDIYEKAKAADIPCSMIEDNGLTEFHGVKTRTVVAVGPDEAEKIDKITGGLKLY